MDEVSVPDLLVISANTEAKRASAMASQMQPARSDDLDDIGKAVLQGIQEDDFSSDAVDALLSLVQDGGNHEVLADVLTYLTNENHPDWAAEICRMVMGGPDGKMTAEERDFATIAAALTHVVQSQTVSVARKISTFILEIKPDGRGGNFFDCYDISLVLGHMAQQGNGSAAAQILYDMYCDETEQGRMYQSLLPFVLGSLVQHNHTEWATQLAKDLMMYNEEQEYPDYSVVSWALSQMVYAGHADWAASICLNLQRQRLGWYQEQDLLQHVAHGSGYQYSQAIQGAIAAARRSNQSWQRSPGQSTNQGRGYGQALNNGTAAPPANNNVVDGGNNNQGAATQPSQTQEPGADVKSGAESLAAAVNGLKIDDQGHSTSNTAQS